jgi:hypothetical protein
LSIDSSERINMPYVYAHAAHEIRGNGTAIVALITGLLGMVMTVVTGWIPIVGFFLMLLPSVLAIIFGFVGRAQARAGAPHGAKAVAGLTCGFVALLLTVLMQLCWGLVLGGVVISAAEMAEQVGGIDELQDAGQEIQQRVQAEWTRINAGFPEREIEIVDEEGVAPQPSGQNEAPAGDNGAPALEHKNESQQDGNPPAKGFLDGQAEQVII